MEITMPVKFETTRMDNYLFVESSGEMSSFEDGIEYIQAQVTTASREGIRRLLLDERNLTVTIDYSDILALAEYWEKNNLQTMGLRVASMPPVDAPQAQLAYETPAVNRSIMFKVFFDRQEAEDWLLNR
ncbi:hypothetical protein JCM14722_14220 [Pseudodesulfovibrio portus]|uniref:STAS/SEC14 domain-containing protein n=2 Tax=Pseudodesulfovibrio portus TaxID=231439 RepID=A0ABN6RWF7_9BACT|nr:hypothetical protein JCM14722_14220 [Pseudodesulfovibrio portus]